MDFSALLEPRLLAYAVIVLVAAFTQGLTGFGFALVSAPFLLLLLDPKLVVLLNLLLSTIPCVLIVIQAREWVALRRIVPLALASLAGAPVGAYILRIISPSTLKLAMAALIVLFVIPMLLGFSRSFRREVAASGFFGFISGILSSSTSLSGPPVVLFAVNQGWQKEALRASLAAYFLFSNLMALLSLAVAGSLSARPLQLALVLAPATLLGFYLAGLVYPRVNPQLFRTIAIILVLVTGLAAASAEVARLI